MSSASLANPFAVRSFVAASKAATAVSIERREKIGIIGSTPVRKVGSTDPHFLEVGGQSAAVVHDGALEELIRIRHVVRRQRRPVLERRLDEPAADDLPVGPRHEARAVGQVGDGVVVGVVAVEAAVHEAAEGEGRDAALLGRDLPTPPQTDVHADPQGVGVGGRRGGCRGGGERGG
jgi:hypothetical protein